MKRILALLRRDLLSTSKDYILFYATVAPLLLALGLRLFLPAVQQTTVNVVVTQAMPAQVQEHLLPYFNVEVVADRAALDQRVLAYDDAVGIVPSEASEATGQGGYTLVLEGNESHDSRVLPRMVLQDTLGGGTIEPPQMVDLHANQLPFREIIGAFMAMMTMFIGSIVMGLHIVEDKESRIMQALGVSPLSRREYIAARGLLVYLLSVVMVFGSLWIMGLAGFDVVLAFAIILVGGVMAVLAGFVLGSLSSNQIAAIANMKFGVMLVLMPALLTLFVPQQYWFALYWAPTYWTYTAFKAVLSNGGWAEVAPMLLWNLGVTAVFLAIAYRWLRGRLDFARE